MKTLTQLIALVRLDLRLFLADRRALIMLFVVPIGIASFMGSLFGGSGTKGGKSGIGGGGGMDIVMVDEDGSAVSRGVVAAFQNDAQFKVLLTNAAAARDLVLNGKRPVALVLPKGFGADAIPGWFDAKRRPEITVWHDPSRSMERSLVEGLLVPKVVQAVAGNALTPEVGRDFIRKGLTNLDRGSGRMLGQSERFREWLQRSDDYLATLPSGGRLTTGGTNTFSIPLPFSTKSQALTRTATAEYNGYAHSFAGMGIQFVLMSLLDMSIGLLRDREAGMFRRLRAAPLRRGTWLFAKTLSFGLISLVSLTGCFAFAMVVFGVRIEGSWAGFVACLVAVSAMSATLALTIAAIGGTPAGTRGVGIAALLMLVMVGGAWVPAFVFPKWLQSVSRVTPTRWAVDGLDAMTWRGLGWDAAVGPVGALIAFTALFGLIAWLRFRWETE